MTQPIFFISYGRPQSDNEMKQVEKAVNRLRDRVLEITGAGRDSRAVGFFDVQSINNGADWEQFLSAAVSRIGVIVCFCSQRYFGSAYCANEFEAFKQRFDRADARLQGRTPGPLIPVVWDLPPPARMPAALRRFYQNGDKSFPKAYDREGLLTLARLPIRSSAFTQTIDVLAKYIVAAAKAPRLPELVPLAKFDELASSFHNPKPGPYNLTITVFEPDGARWNVDGLGHRLAVSVDSVAEKTGVGWREIPAKDDFVMALAEATAEHAVHVFVVPEHLAGTEPWKTRLDTLGNSAVDAGVLLVAADTGAGAVDGAVARVLAQVPSLAARKLIQGSFDPTVPAELDDSLMTHVTHLRTQLIKAVEPSKIQSPTLDAPKTRPIVSGPAHSAATGQGQV